MHLTCSYMIVHVVYSMWHFEPSFKCSACNLPSNETVLILTSLLLPLLLLFGSLLLLMSCAWQVVPGAVQAETRGAADTGTPG